MESFDIRPLFSSSLSDRDWSAAWDVNPLNLCGFALERNDAIANRPKRYSAIFFSLLKLQASFQFRKQIRDITCAIYIMRYNTNEHREIMDIIIPEGVN